MKKLLLLCAAAFILSACDTRQRPPEIPRETVQVNGCLQAELFKSCMAILPAGPMATKYNDWDEVVSECNSSARSQSWRLTSTIPLECRTSARPE